MEPNEPGPSSVISEEDEVFTHDLDVFGLAAGLTVLREAHRPPISAKVVTPRRSGPNVK
jgi:hypothetical protein